MSDRRTTLHLVLGILLLGMLIAWGIQKRAATAATRRAEAATAAADSLRRVADSLEGAYRVDTLTLTRWRTRWDSIVGPGRTDTLTIERVIAVADTTIRACTAALSTCEQRVAVERERGDSLAVAVASWRKVARGPWLTPRLELTVTPHFQPEAAAEVTVGRNRLRLLARAEVGQEAAVRFGVSWSP